MNSKNSANFPLVMSLIAGMFPLKVNHLAKTVAPLMGAAPEGRGLQDTRHASAGMGIREYTSGWLSGAGVLFSVALSISLTLSPLTSHLWWARWYLWKHGAALARGQRRKLGPSAAPSQRVNGQILSYLWEN